ncbi:MAG: hypothetical protein Q7K45_05030, partial [Nanoarchaeota archaeon]|nr:hypothetical protein [Nanoarchaeota archaeon]
LPSPVATFSDEVGVDEEEIAPAIPFNLGTVLESLCDEASPTLGYKTEIGIYFAGRRPSCTILGLRRSNKSEKVDIIPAEHLLEITQFIRENKQQPYSLFVIDALPQDAFSGVEAIVQETAGNKLYFNHKPLVAVVQKGVEGLLSRLQERYASTPLRFIEAKKYGSEVIDANLFGQLRY